MPLVTWNENLSVGVVSIDDQHKKLVTLLNQLHDGMIAGKGRDVLANVLKGLVDYTKTHFKYEEELFTRAGYPGAASHKKDHAELIQRVIDIHQKYNMTGPAALTIPVMNFLKDWLTNHIQGSDKRYVPHLKAKGIH